MERKIISPFPLAEEAPQKQRGPLQLALPPEKRVVMAHPTNIQQDILSTQKMKFPIMVFNQGKL